MNGLRHFGTASYVALGGSVGGKVDYHIAPSLVDVPSNIPTSCSHIMPCDVSQTNSTIPQNL